MGLAAPRRPYEIRFRRCRVHGGATPRGAASPHWRHGRYSGYLGGELGRKLEEQLADPDTHSMAVELGLVGVRTAELLQGLPTGGSSAAWAQLAEALAVFEDAQARSQVAKMGLAFRVIKECVAQGNQQAQAWDEIMRLIDRRQRMVESEEKRALASGRAVPADQVASMLQSLAAAVLDELPEPAARRRVVERARRLLVGRTLVLEAGE